MNLQVSLPYFEPCVFQCPFCIMKTHQRFRKEVLSPIDFANALAKIAPKYDRLVFTGENEPLQSMDYFVQSVLSLPQDTIIELTFKGYHFYQLKENYFEVLRRINVVNLSICSSKNETYTECYDRALLIAQQCKELGITTRFTFLLTNDLSPHMVRHAVRSVWVDQITLKELQGDTKIVKSHHNNTEAHVLYEEAMGKPLVFTQRFIIFNYQNQPIWIDTNCQDGEGNYVIFRPDGNIYDHWDSE